MKVKELKEYLKSNGFRCVSREEPRMYKFINDDYSINVTIERNMDKLTVEEEEAIKERLKALGYMD